MSLEFAPDVQNRIRKQWASESAMRNDGEYMWWSSLGDYDFKENKLFENHRTLPEKHNGVSLGTYEVFLYNQTKRLLENNEGDQPVVLLDIGGGAGLSWSKLALAYEEEVKRGDIAFVVSNLSSTPEQQIANHNHHKRGYEEPDPIKRAREKDLVHYVNGNLNRLLHQTKISLPNEQKLPLKGNVDLVHERSAITLWSYIPDLDVRKIGKLLSPTSGIYSVNKTDIESSCAYYYDRSEHITQAKQLAHKGLKREFGLLEVTHIEAGKHKGKPLENHLIFRTPKAPLIEA